MFPPSPPPPLPPRGTPSLLGISLGQLFLRLQLFSPVLVHLKRRGKHHHAQRHHFALERKDQADPHVAVRRDRAAEKGAAPKDDEEPEAAVAFDDMRLGQQFEQAGVGAQAGVQAGQTNRVDLRAPRVYRLFISSLMDLVELVEEWGKTASTWTHHHHLPGTLGGRGKDDCPLERPAVWQDTGHCGRDEDDVEDEQDDLDRHGEEEPPAGLVA